MPDGWQERRSDVGDCGMHIASRGFGQNQRCAAISVIRRRGCCGRVQMGWSGHTRASTRRRSRFANRTSVPVENVTGQDIARQGEPSDAMHFILKGRVGIFVGMDGGHMVRVRSLGHHTTIGEMGLITGRPRSATIRAEVATVLYQLPLDAYRQIVLQDPTLGQALAQIRGRDDGGAVELRKSGDRRAPALAEGRRPAAVLVGNQIRPVDDAIPGGTGE